MALMFIALFVGVPVLAVIRGFTVVLLWGWFVTPVFAAAPDINIAVAIGLGFLVAVLSGQVGRDANTQAEKRKEIESKPVSKGDALNKAYDALARMYLRQFSSYVIVIAFGFVVSRFV